jgi:hypothetical protein
MPTQIEIIKAMPPINEPNFIFKNKNGLQFTKKTKEWGFDKKSQSNGAVYADLDNDGDLDIVTNNINEKAFLYLNNSQSNTDFGYLKVQLQAENEGQKIGAKVVVWQNGKVQYQEFQPTRGFQSAMYVPLIFGVEKKAVVDSIEVFWNNNTKTVVKNVKSNTSVTVKKLESSKKISQFLPIENHIFKETQSISFLHSQPFSNDFKIQPLLPEMRSFILPGGHLAASSCHVARCVCRRAERICVHLSEESHVDETVMIYLNRLSDYLFVLARMLCFDQKIEENKWIPRV